MAATRPQIDAIIKILRTDPNDSYQILDLAPPVQIPQNPTDYLQITDTTQYQNEIKKNYRRLSILVHPDRNPAPAATTATQILNAAYEVVNSPGKQDRYESRVRRAAIEAQRVALAARLAELRRDIAASEAKITAATNRRAAADGTAPASSPAGSDSSEDADADTKQSGDSYARIRSIGWFLLKAFLALSFGALTAAIFQDFYMEFLRNLSIALNENDATPPWIGAVIRIFLNSIHWDMSGIWLFHLLLIGLIYYPSFCFGLLQSWVLEPATLFF